MVNAVLVSRECSMIALRFPACESGPRYSLLARHRRRRLLHKRLNSVVLKASPRISLTDEDDLFMLKLSRQRRRRDEMRKGKWTRCLSENNHKEREHQNDRFFVSEKRACCGSPLRSLSLSACLLPYTMTRNVRSSSCFFFSSFSSQATEQCIC
jgi:hypothetical protein